MAVCSTCYRELTESIYERNGKYKSCPNCSKVLGHHAFYKVEHFGERHHTDGSPFIQSWCPICRGHSGRIGSPKYTH
jgi:DNA-directed RNA polymerase subunit RPC12/RpoP